jgi:hypothetical protein
MHPEPDIHATIVVNKDATAVRRRKPRVSMYDRRSDFKGPIRGEIRGLPTVAGGHYGDGTWG